MHAAWFSSLGLSACLAAIAVSPVTFSAPPPAGAKSDFEFGALSPILNSTRKIDLVDHRRLNRVAITPGTMDAEMIPVRLSISVGVMSAGQAAEISVTVSSVPVGGGYVQLMCTSPGALQSPNGTWPYSVFYPGGSSATQTINFTAGSILLPETAVFYMAGADADPNDMSQWDVAGTILVLPGL
jgi:hypothetical protein